MTGDARPDRDVDRAGPTREVLRARAVLSRFAAPGDRVVHRIVTCEGAEEAARQLAVRPAGCVGGR